MKKLFAVIFALSFAGCMHYATPHGQDITLKNIEKLPVKVGLYMPEAISKDSVEVDIGDQPNWSHWFVLRSGAAMANAIYKAVSASVNVVVVSDSLTNQKQIDKDSLAFIIAPVVIRRNATIWPSAWNLIKNYDASTFETRIRLNLIDNHDQPIDSIVFNAVGVSGRIIDSIHVIDSVIADAADSAIASIQDQIVYNLTRNNKLRSYLGLSNPTNNITIVTPATHGLYGKTSQFELDTNSYTLRPIPQVRRWSYWEGDGLNFSSAREIINFWFGVDLLLQSRFSFRLGLFILNYSQSGDTYYSFAESKFITPEPVQLLDWGVFAQTSYLFFGPRFFAEAGVGVNTIFGNGFTGIINIPGQRRFEPKGIIGLRYQSILGGFCFGAGYTPYIDLNGFQNHMSLSAGFAL